MKKHTIRLLISLVVFTILINPISVKAIEEDFVSILIYEDEEGMIFAEVPKEDEAKFLQEIENDDTREYYVNQSKSNRMMRTPGNCKAKYLKEDGILEVMDSVDSKFNYLAYLSNPFSEIVLQRIYNFFITKTATQLISAGLFGAMSGVIGWAASSLQSRQIEWWKDSYIMFSRKKIRGVKMELCENISGSNYPAAYRYITRY